MQVLELKIEILKKNKDSFALETINEVDEEEDEYN